MIHAQAEMHQPQAEMIHAQAEMILTSFWLERNTRGSNGCFRAGDLLAPRLKCIQAQAEMRSSPG